MHKNLKKLLVLFLILVIPVTSYGASFPDMPNDWSRPALEYMIKEGLIKGIDGKIMADQQLTRAQLVTMMNRKLDLKETTDISNFKDLNKKAWYYKELQKGVKFGLIQGSNNRLRPNDPITRQEAFAIVDRAIKPENKNIQKKFKDDNKISGWAKNSIYRLSGNGYINGSNGRINPKKHISRKEFSQVLYNIEKVQDDKNNGDSNVSIKPIEPEKDKDKDKDKDESGIIDIDKKPEPAPEPAPSFELDGNGRKIINNQEQLDYYLGQKLSNFERNFEFSTKDLEFIEAEFENTINKFYMNNADLDYGYGGYKLVRYPISKVCKAEIIYTNQVLEGIEDKALIEKYRKSKSQMKKEKEIVDKKVDQILSKIINDNMTDYEKEKAIHDYIVLNADYADDYLTNTKRSYYTPYGILIEGRGVCDGYSKTFLTMAKRAGLEAKYIRGDAAGYHSWNMIKLDGDWYHLDLTWNDQGGDRIIYKFFNLDDKTMRKTHTPETTYVSYPKANGRKYHRDTLGLK